MHFVADSNSRFANKKALSVKDIIHEPFILTEYGQLCYLDIRDLNIDIWKQLIYHKNKWISKSLKTFIDYVIKEEFSD